MTAASDDGTRQDVSWHQSFGWGLLTVVDDDARTAELPVGVGQGAVSASTSWLAVPVRHAQDVEAPDGWPDDLGIPGAQVAVVVAFQAAAPGDPVHFDGELWCPSGRLMVGDPETERQVDVVAGAVRIQVSLFPAEHAEAVVLRLLPASCSAAR
ncbi:hypothetical protein [Aquipuribacter hungaricus]|uniref:Uncharacterized protein n=1 Tax=Aquipuribacter hungaricus TaxID=545624 RepID=A0ABV7WGX1_9MICO